MEALVKIVIHTKDLCHYNITGIPEKVKDIDDITDDIMEHGAYSYEGNLATFIPPDNISRIEYTKGEVPDEDEDDPK